MTLFADIIFIEHLVASTNDPKNFDTFISAFSYIFFERAETVASIIKKVAEVLDLKGDVKVIKRTIIPRYSSVQVKCKTNIQFEIEENSGIFQPLIDPQVDKTVEFKESCKTVGR